MFNYLKSEFFHTYKQKGNYILAAGCAALVTLLGVLSFISRQSIIRDQALGKVSSHPPISPLLPFELYNQEKPLWILGVILFVALFIAMSHKIRGIHRQLISTGQTRLRIFFGDYLMVVIQALIMAFSLVLWSMLTALFLTGHVNNQQVIHMAGGAGTINSLADFIMFVGYLLLLMLPVLACAHACFEFVQNTGLAMTLFFAFSTFLPQILEAVSIAWEREPVGKFLLAIVKWTPYHFLKGCFTLDFGSGALWLMIAANLVFWLGLGYYSYWVKEL